MIGQQQLRKQVTRNPPGGRTRASPLPSALPLPCRSVATAVHETDRANVGR